MHQDAGRAHIVQRLADLLGAVERPHPVRVAIDGRSGAGKSILGDELAALLRPLRPVIRASVDDFYGLWLDKRNRRSLSAEAFYTDAYDYPALRSLLLAPLGLGGSRRYRSRWHDGWNEGEIAAPELVAPDAALLLVDGVFLLRPELRDCWDVCIFMDVDAEQSLLRGVERDATLDEPAVRASRRADRVRVYRERYLPADDRYLSAVDPSSLADIIVDNRILESPRLTPTATLPALDSCGASTVATSSPTVNGWERSTNVKVSL